MLFPKPLVQRLLILVLSGLILLGGIRFGMAAAMMPQASTALCFTLLS